MSASEARADRNAPDDGRVDERGRRQSLIIRRLDDNGRVSVPELARELDVTEMTIRRDLGELHRAGRAVRIHGGAVSPRSEVERRAAENSPEKLAIAARAASLIPNGATVAIDLGSTCEAVARILSHRDDLTVVTNALPIATQFRQSRSTLVLLGGILNSDLNLVNTGAFGPDFDMPLDYVVLGCAGVSPTTGMMHFDAAELAVRRRFVDCATHRILVADHTKFRSRAPFALGSINLLDVLVTDSGAPEAELAEFTGLVDVDIAPPLSAS
ncbi:DeoR/GlpR family DNA-binding transcription regulator [Compostimonas suwonensis]|uniref:DeoR family glycerol-3-phosphate regulon repressor n=1 Tax=Compostimonas suwonensis TaxID=1048394 RepID=A0A2M9BBQ6_9MICO|nr:DeoR/GlpR family DNA-binding transcription regulator [Compostimonas suwonensis]PJJ55375.1 DeoR family glycerol-3-phosphate regulon repressor [Compostimonas suwonensis]